MLRSVGVREPGTARGTRAMLLELRTGGGDKGAQTIFPGSAHRDIGLLVRLVDDDRQEVKVSERSERVNGRGGVYYAVAMDRISFSYS